MILQVYTLDISPLLEQRLYEKYLACVSSQRVEKAGRYKSISDQARCIGGGILLAIAYEQFQKSQGESAGADSLFTCPCMECVFSKEHIVAKSSMLSESMECTGNIGNAGKNEGDICDTYEWKICNDIDTDMLCKLTCRLPEEKTDEKGKPYFVQGPNFNISHAKNLVVLAMADRNVGIDVEAARPCKESVMKKCFSEDEIQRVTDDPLKRDETFTEIWTTKEAMAKLTGRGIADIWEKKKPEGILLHTFRLNEIYAVSICVADET